MAKAPIRDVVKVLELEGEKGGHMLVLVLDCGCYKTTRSKRPPKTTPCIACFVRDQLEDEPLPIEPDPIELTEEQYGDRATLEKAIAVNGSVVVKRPDGSVKVHISIPQTEMACGCNCPCCGETGLKARLKTKKWQVFEGKDYKPKDLDVGYRGGRYLDCDCHGCQNGKTGCINRPG